MKEITLIGFVQTLFFSLLILTKKERKIKDYFLVVFLLFVGAELLYRHLLFDISEAEYKWLVLFDISYWALFGPITLFYILTSTNQVLNLKIKHFFHLIPLLIGVLAVKDFLFGEIYHSSFVDYFNNSTGLTKIALYFWEFCSPIYIVYSLFTLMNHKKVIKNFFSDIEGKDVKWLSVLLTGFVIYLSIWYLIWIIEAVFLYEVTINMLGLLPTVLTVYVFFIGFYGFKQTGLLFDFSKKSDLRVNSSENKYQKSGLDEDERVMLSDELNKIMKIDKPYLESNLTVNDLAKMLDTSFHKLSQVINESFDKSFYDYINYFRIEESKRLLRSPESEKYKIIAIAYDSGFSSKSSFYNAFRKNTGVTPGEYFKKVKSLPSNKMYN